MNVKEIRDRVVELSQGGGGADGELNGRALGWLNSAYFELLDELLPYAPQDWLVREDGMTDADGRLALAQPVQRLVAVADRAAGVLLTVSTPLAVLENDPAGTANGVPVNAYVEPSEFATPGAYLVVQPRAAGVKLAVVYLPRPDALGEDDGAKSILIPVTQHSGLVWGALVWASLFEKSFSASADVAMYQAKWQAAKEATKRMLLGSGRTLRVVPFTEI